MQLLWHEPDVNVCRLSKIKQGSTDLALNRYNIVKRWTKNYQHRGSELEDIVIS